MRILFCRIEWMERYKGVVEKYKLIGKDSFNREQSRKYESINFETDLDDKFVYGYVPTKHHNGKANSIHIERFEDITKEDKSAENVLIVWVSKKPIKNGESLIVGWYKNAEVLREYNYIDIEDERWPINIIAFARDVVLLPTERRELVVPWAGGVNGEAYGMAQSNIWFADKEEDVEYIKEVINYIENYKGDNWLYKQ